jgi:hypothetical protein
MSSRMLVTLLAALAVLVALAIAVSLSQRPAADGGLLLPGLKAQVNDIDRITVRAGGNRTVATLERRQDSWVLAERNAYPADLGKIRRNLIALAEAKILEEKTSNPELYGRLEVSDIEKKDAAGVRLDLGTGQALTGVIIGKTGVGGGERAYARRAGEPTSWLVSGSFDTSAETADWLDRSVLDIQAGRIHAVTISHPGAATLRIEKSTPEAQDFTVNGVPAGRELSFPGAGNSIGAGLSGLTLDNVEPAAGFAPGETRPIVARYETFDGLVIEISTWRLPAGPFVRFTASADKALADRFAPPAATAKPAGQKDADNSEATAAAAKPATRRSFDEVKAEAAQLNKRLGNWVYTLPDFKGEQFTKKLEDLLQPRPPAK